MPMVNPRMFGMTMSGDKSSFDSNKTDYSTGTEQKSGGMFGSSPVRQTTQQPTQPQPTNGTLLGTQTSQPMSFGAGPVSSDQIRSYFSSRGVNPRDTSPDYWSGKWGELVNRGKELNPGTDGSWYANKFLSNAEEFTGGPDQTAMNMWGFNPSQMGQQQQSQGLGMFQSLLPQLMQMLQGGGMRNTSQAPQQVSNGSLFGNANQPQTMDISSLLNPQSQGSGFAYHPGMEMQPGVRY